MKIKNALLIFLFLALSSQKNSAHDLGLESTSKSIRITQSDVTRAAAEKNMLTFGAAGLILGICKREVPNLTGKSEQDVRNGQTGINVVSLLGLLIAIAKDIHTGHGFKNTTALRAGMLAGSMPELLLETSAGLIAGRVVGAAIDKLANDASKPNRFESTCMKNGTIIGAMFGAANQKQRPLHILATGLTAYRLIDHLTKRPL